MVSQTRRRASRITYEILKKVDEKGESTKFDIWTVVTSEAQFRHWIEDFMLKDGIIKERREGRHYYYTMTDLGREVFNVLKKQNLFNVLMRVSGKTLRSYE